jgi:hypothetical protein
VTIAGVGAPPSAAVGATTEVSCGRGLRLLPQPDCLVVECLACGELFAIARRQRLARQRREFRAFQAVHGRCGAVPGGEPVHQSDEPEEPEQVEPVWHTCAHCGCNYQNDSAWDDDCGGCVLDEEQISQRRQSP